MSTEKEFESLWQEAHNAPQRKTVETNKTEVRIELEDVLNRYFAYARPELAAHPETQEALQNLIRQSRQLRSSPTPAQGVRPAGKKRGKVSRKAGRKKASKR